MTAPLQIPFARDPAYEPSDVVQAEVDGGEGGELLPDRWPAATDRADTGFGFDDPSALPFGRLAFTPDRIPFGLGAFGVGAELATLRTRGRYGSGNYTVRVRVGDGLPADPAGSGEGLGNLSDWSVAFTHYHRVPADQLRRPRNLRRSGESGLAWDF